jgi:putative membrane protein
MGYLSKDRRRLLVVYVDEDDDIGRNANVKTPILGRQANLEAAMQLALATPEDSDVNALFAAVQVLDKLRGEGMECELVTLAGALEGGVKADLKVVKELDEALKAYPADAAVVVSDGAADERVIPLIQSKLPIASVRSVIVRQSRGLEETYFLLVRYLKRVLEDPRSSAYLLGIPGVFMVAVAILASLGLAHYAGVMLLFILGVALVVKGFSIDRALTSAWSSSPIMFTSAVMSLITFIVAAYLGSTAVASHLSAHGEVGLAEAPRLVGVFLALPNMPLFLTRIYNVDIIMAGVIILLVGRGVDKHLRGRPRAHHEALSAVLCVLLILLLRQVADLLVNPLQTPLTFLLWMGVTVAVYSSLLAASMLIERWRKARA